MVTACYDESLAIVSLLWWICIVAYNACIYKVWRGAYNVVEMGESHYQGVRLGSSGYLHARLG